MSSERENESILKPKLNLSMLFNRRENLVDTKLIFGFSALFTSVIVAPILIFSPAFVGEEIYLILFISLYFFAPVVYFFFVFKEYKNFRYVINSGSIQVINDYIDKSYEGTSFDNISNVKLRITFLQQYFNTGDVILETPGSDEKNIKLSHLENPEKTYERLSEKVKETEYSHPGKGKRKAR